MDLHCLVTLNASLAYLHLACMADVRRGRKEERQVREAQEDRTWEDRARGRLQGHFCFLYSTL